MHASFLEIYNDTIRDLLCKDPNRKGKALEAKHDPKTNKTLVPDLTLVKVATYARVYDLLRRATTNRATAETNMNHCSSRSHSIFQLQITGKNSITGESVEGLLKKREASAEPLGPSPLDIGFPLESSSPTSSLQMTWLPTTHQFKEKEEITSPLLPTLF